MTRPHGAAATPATAGGGPLPSADPPRSPGTRLQTQAPVIAPLLHCARQRAQAVQGDDSGGPPDSAGKSVSRFTGGPHRAAAVSVRLDEQCRSCSAARRTVGHAKSPWAAVHGHPRPSPALSLRPQRVLYRRTAHPGRRRAASCRPGDRSRRWSARPIPSLAGTQPLGEHPRDDRRRGRVGFEAVRAPAPGVVRLVRVRARIRSAGMRT
jgi:hypothetical protein